jgi:dipeptide/tripeptide permease
MLWMLPQYGLLTMGEVMFSITSLAFAFTQVNDPKIWFAFSLSQAQPQNTFVNSPPPKKKQE